MLKYYLLYLQVLVLMVLVLFYLLFVDKSGLILDTKYLFEPSLMTYVCN